MKKTPPIERPSFVPLGFLELSIASQMSAKVIAALPKING